MSAPLLDEKIVAIGRALAEAEVPHAFGGALALAYYATPRATLDIDLNLFVAVDAAPRVLDLLRPLGVEPPSPAERRALADRGQMRIFWGHTPLDLFFAYDALHDACLARLRRVPFGDGPDLPILSAEDLAVFKVLFDRDKDWRDLDELLFSLAAEFDGAYAQGWLERILEPRDTRLERFRELLAAESGASGWP